MVTFGEVHLLEERPGRRRVDDPPCRTAQAARPDALGPGREDDVLAQQTAVYLAHVVARVVGDADDAGRIDEDVFEALALGNLRVVAHDGRREAVYHGRREHANLVSLHVAAVRGVDAAGQDVVQRLPADGGVFVTAYAPAAHHQLGDDVVGRRLGGSRRVGRLGSGRAAARQQQGGQRQAGECICCHTDKGVVGV